MRCAAVGGAAPREKPEKSSGGIRTRSTPVACSADCGKEGGVSLKGSQGVQVMYAR